MKDTTMRNMVGLEIRAMSCHGECDAIVAVCDRTLGVTIKRWEDEKDIQCINREQFIRRAQQNGLRKPWANRLWHQYFSLIVEHIVNGRVRTHSCAVNYFTEEIWEREYIVGRPVGEDFSCAVGNK